MSVPPVTQLNSDLVFDRIIDDGIINMLRPMTFLNNGARFLSIAGRSAYDHLQNEEPECSINEDVYIIKMMNVHLFPRCIGEGVELTRNTIMVCNIDRFGYFFINLDELDVVEDNKLLDYYNSLEETDEFLSGDIHIEYDSLTGELALEL